MSSPTDKKTNRWDRFCRRHPALLWALILALAFVAGSLMIAASRISAVLYKDF